MYELGSIELGVLGFLIFYIVTLVIGKIKCGNDCSLLHKKNIWHWSWMLGVFLVNMIMPFVAMVMIIVYIVHWAVSDR